MNARLAGLAAAALLSFSCQSGGTQVKGAQNAGAPVPAWTRLSAEEARALLARRPGALVLDVRAPEEWNDELGHIETARQIPIGELPERLGEIAAFEDSAVVVVCRSGNRSRRASDLLVGSGFREVYNLEGGMDAWRRAGY